MKTFPIELVASYLNTVNKISIELCDFLADNYRHIN